MRSTEQTRRLPLTEEEQSRSGHRRRTESGPNPDIRPLATPSLELNGGFWAARGVSGKKGSGLVRLVSPDRSEKNRTEGGNDANTSWDQWCRARVDCRRLGANRDGVLEGSRSGCSGQVDDGLGRKQSRHHRGALFQGRSVVGHAFAHGSIRSCRAEVILRGRLSNCCRSSPSSSESNLSAYTEIPQSTRYTLFYTKDGETKSIPARYSFTFVKEGSDCKIVDHHSSTVPPPPR
jgi:hypothetical protein